MVYQTRWDYSRAESCRLEAEKRAGYSPFGFLYRFEEQNYSQSSGWGDDEYHTVTYIELEAFPIKRRTTHGWTILANNGLGWRFVSETTHRRFALPTIKEALESYIARKEKQASIYTGLADRATNLAIRAKAGLNYITGGTTNDGNIHRS